MNAPRIKVLCVDDSALIRDLLSEIINEQPDMEVVATAPDPLVARDLIKQYNPDVLTLDVEMPRMDGLDFLERLMRLRPMPVLMVSSLTQAGSEVTLRALELGALDFVAKPSLGIRSGMKAYAEEITEKLRAAARSRPKRARKRDTPVPRALEAPMVSSEKLVIIGASTGGTEAIRSVLEPMPANGPAILITQHMPGGFTRSFAERLDRICRIAVKEARDGERILPGHAYVAPGDAHLKLVRNGANYVVRLDGGPPVNRHRPSVDVLFCSAADQAGRNAIGVLLTGMGKDGAAGLLEMRRAGAATLAQDEASCVVFGMPREAIALDAAEEVVGLDDMAARLLKRVAASGRSQRV
ncbi:chemotaxis response regulator protein-glutamate methylesterase [Halomonas sabkhae]|uniref:Protein-glutamate methylesterase/protein-glutamine glutaminase n=1 Tax=Halomonas halmophila TaxID=252 RepID=A0A4Y4F0U8_9GAMM|nr:MULTISPECIES: chemotaxis response regulator protein-glutamate methylesterase [Halomonas]MDN3524850.1 chemotaxis response regulator protein-glutamate methylesterase [Halomonas sabkhae]GED22893.1 chemotaxis response regulator protein-glutamate methylesterase 1 [Halomonas halmophila]